MRKYYPPHSGKFIKEVYLDKLGISEREVAQNKSRTIFFKSSYLRRDKLNT